jgi:predicted nucleic-acid-binding protein
MCGFTVNLIDFDKLTPAQKKALLKNYKKKKADYQALIRDADRSLKGIEKALVTMQKKTAKKSAKKAKR